MKEYQNFLMASLLLVGAIACTKDAIPSPLSSVTVKDGDKEVVAEIDHTAKTVKFDKFAEIDDFAAVKVNIAVANGASLVSPAADAVVDFTKQPVEIVVNDAVNDVIYSMTAKKPDPFKGVKVGGKPASVEGINITLPYDKETMDITRLKLDIALRKGANVVKPAEAVFDFSVKTTQGLTISYLGKDYIKDQSNEAVWENIYSVPDEVIWNTRVQLKNKLIDYIRARFRENWLRNQGDPSLVVSLLDKINPNALLIGFARRFAT